MILKGFSAFMNALHRATIFREIVIIRTLLFFFVKLNNWTKQRRMLFSLNYFCFTPKKGTWSRVDFVLLKQVLGLRSIIFFEYFFFECLHYICVCHDMFQRQRFLRVVHITHAWEKLFEKFRNIILRAIWILGACMY